MHNKTQDPSRTPIVRDVPAVTRAVTLLRVLARAEAPMGVVALAREIDAIPSTCLHILRVMVDLGLATFNRETKKYALGAGVLALASSFSHRNPLAQLAGQALEDLSRSNRCAFAAIEQTDDDHLMVAAIGDVNMGVAVRLTTGTRLPIVMSASGRCFAAFGNFTPADLRRRFAKLRWENPPSYEAWLAEIEQTRKLGYAIDAGNYMTGISVVAVPVFVERDTIVGCITGVDFKDRLDGAQLERMVASMISVAANLSWKMGGGVAPVATKAPAVA